MLWQKMRSPEMLGVRYEMQSFEHRESKCKTTFYNGVAKDKKLNVRAGREIRDATCLQKLGSTIVCERVIYLVLKKAKDKTGGQTTNAIHERKSAEIQDIIRYIRTMPMPA